MGMGIALTLDAIMYMIYVGYCLDWNVLAKEVSVFIQFSTQQYCRLRMILIFIEHVSQFFVILNYKAAQRSALTNDQKELKNQLPATGDNLDETIRK